jgi:hypothetical protein
MLKNYVWTIERLSEKTSDELNNVRQNAIARGNEGTVLLCDAEIARRKPPKKPSSGSHMNARPVRGFHFVCRAEKGVVYNGDGTFWSGSWVVAKQQAERSEKINAYVALHEKQSEQSYLQGIIKDWRPAPRERQYSDEEVQTDEGIEFLLEPISAPLPWRGEGTVERSYWYGDDEPSKE